MEKIYTYENWREDRTLKVQEGQLIDEEVFDDLLCCMPPTTYRYGFFQPGEAYSHDWNTGRALYRTFELQECGLYKYVGLRPAI